MTDHKSIDYAALEARLADPDATLSSAGQVATGPAAAATGREFLVREYGSIEAVERAMPAPGRPRVGHGGVSPTVRARITPADYAAMKRLEEQTGRSQSDLLREAVHQLLAAYKMVS